MGKIEVYRNPIYAVVAITICNSFKSFQSFKMSDSFPSDRTVYDADNWRPGYTLMICNEHGKVPNLPINVDNLTFHNCTFDVLDLRWLDGESLKTLTLHGCRIRDVRGLSTATEAKTLRIYHSSIENLEIPPHLETLWLDFDSHHTEPTIHSFPETLKTLSLRMRSMRELQPLPSGLKKLCVTGCRFPLPDSLPPNLKELLCFEMEYLSELPPLPVSLTYLDCANCAISGRLELPPRIQYLDCSSNSIVGELNLPASLTYLDCSHNRITSISSLPPRMRRLVCAFNRITQLPPLPASLRTLNFSANPIERYPYIYDPSMHILMSMRGQYFRVLGNEKDMVDGVKVFPPPFEPELKEHLMSAEWASGNHALRRQAGDEDDFDSATSPHNEILELVLEVQRQVDGRKFLGAIKEELMAATWNPSRVEAWCGVDFSDPESD